MSGIPGKRSLQEVLRERRAATPLLSPVEASQREAARRRDAVDAAAAEALARWRDGRSPDGRGKLALEVYRKLFALNSAAYYASGHWSRRARAQLAHAPACEVATCGSAADLAAHHLTHVALGEEQPGRDLITLCEGCHRRARKLGQDLARVPTREEVVGLDPAAPLYDSSAIAALKAKYGN
jgi:5-methylcytosine-specific restriction endonuclease McrA